MQLIDERQMPFHYDMRPREVRQRRGWFEIDVCSERQKQE